MSLEDRYPDDLPDDTLDRLREIEEDLSELDQQQRELIEQREELVDEHLGWHDLF